MTDVGKVTKPHSMSSKRIDRRIPKDQRRRAAASCDYCKIKRNKCERRSDNDEEPCKACRESGRKCEYTIPRKRRVSSDVPGQRKYEYVDATFYKLGDYGAPDNSGVKNERIDGIKGLSLGATESVSSSVGPYSATTAITGGVPGPNGSPVVNIRSRDGSIVAPTLEEFYRFLTSGEGDLGRRLSAAAGSNPAGDTNGFRNGPTASFPLPTNNNTRTNSNQAIRSAVETSSYTSPNASVSMSGSPQLPLPMSPPEGQVNNNGSSYNNSIPLFANKLRYIGVHGSYSFLVQVRSLFTEDSGTEELNVGPQTMGNDGNASSISSDGIVLPERAFGDSLVERFFSTLHRDYPIFHRESFYKVYQSIWTPGFEGGTSWLVCIYMVFILGIQSCPLPTNVKNSFRDKYLKLVRSLIIDVLSGTSLIDVQALLAYVIHLYFSGQRDESWNLLGAAFRISVGIGLHRGDAGFKLKPVERELRKRVWWTMFMFERMECSSLGRPSCIDDFDCTVDLPRDGVLDMGEDLPFGILQAQINLSIILGTICKRFYLLDAMSSDSLHLASDIYERLLIWRDSLPLHLRHGNGLSSSHYRQMMLLHATYHYTICFLLRPYVVFSASGSWSQISETDQQFVRQFTTVCASSAFECKSYMNRLHDLGYFNHQTWIDVYFLYYTSLILSTHALCLSKEGKHQEFNMVKEHVISNDILFDRYPDKSTTMERFTHVAKEVSCILREVIGKRRLTTFIPFDEIGPAYQSTSENPINNDTANPTTNSTSNDSLTQLDLGVLAQQNHMPSLWYGTT